MISSVVNGKALDWNWEKGQLPFCSNFYVGDIFVGQIFNVGYLGWSAVHREENDLGLVEGFKTRYAASRFLLKLEKDIRY